MKKVQTTDKLCANGCNKPCAPRYKVCQKCRHGAPVPCPTCDGLKTAGAEVCKYCRRKAAIGPNHSCWRGGRIIDGHGYARVWKPDDVRANCGRYMKEHTIVMEKTLGRQMLPHESVHHRNGIKSDNRPKNLELWSKSHPCGQRIEDKVQWAIELLRLYKPNALTSPEF